MSIAYDYSHETSRDAAVILRKQLLIDGRHVESVSGKTFNTLNPATGQVIA
ncbi:MAG TPA: betaine-aldehyde dehydrogenase, partial [Afipia sp.]|nr:betaine-aldehyde dehydrogenase [Afipia sp.]